MTKTVWVVKADFQHTATLLLKVFTDKEKAKDFQRDEIKKHPDRIVELEAVEMVE